MVEITELKAKLATAIANNDDASFMSIIGEIAKEKSAIAKAQAEVAKKEAESLAGDREKLALKLFTAVKAVVSPADLQKVKAAGFTYHMDGPDKEGVMTTYKTVALLVPTVKTARGGTGGGAGKSKDEYGMSLGEIFDKFATEADKAELAKAETNSKQWQVKVAVKKEAIKAGLLQPTK